MIASAEQAEEERIMRDLDSLLCGAVAWARQRWPHLQRIDREDMEQSARCVLLARIRAYDGNSRAQLWTYARPRVLGHFQDLARRTARRHRLVITRSADLGEQPEHNRADLYRHDILRHLAPDEKRVITAHYWEDLSLTAIAREWGRPLWKIKLMHQDAIKRLECAMRDEQAARFAPMEATGTDA